MTTETIARILAQHVMRGWTDRWPLITVMCLCGEETSADDHRGINRHLAIEEIHARHQSEAMQDEATDLEWAIFRASDGENGTPVENLRYRTKLGAQEAINCGYNHPELWVPRSRLIGKWQQ